jgi:biopolymer transport protein ExbD
VRTGINDTPMLGVLLTLLVIFIVATPVITCDYSVLPRATESRAIPEEPVAATLGISADGDLFISAAPKPGNLPAGPRVTNATGLARDLEAWYGAGAADRILFLRAHHQVPFGRIQSALEIARRSGVRIVAAVTEQP